jgi:NADH:ubiquinone oxidoreductase subunit D
LGGAGATEGHPHTDQIMLNIGPQHPSTHGVFRMAAALEGETVMGLRPVFGYLHRCHEKIGERNTFLQNMPSPTGSTTLPPFPTTWAMPWPSRSSWV